MFWKNIMKITSLILIILCIALLSCGNSDEKKFLDECEKSLREFQASKKGLKIPPHLAKDPAEKRGGEFDVNDYFKVLNHLSMEEGYVLDWVYNYNWHEGGPVIYEKKISKIPYKNIHEYLNDVGDSVNFVSFWEYDIGDTVDMRRDEYLMHLQIDSSKAGYFQFIVLKIMGRQFYLYWHEFYNDITIACSMNDINEMIDKHTPKLRKTKLLPILTKAKTLNLNPKVIIKDKLVFVEISYFTAWGGLKRYSCNISRDFPHIISNIKDTTLIEYDCGIRF
jgi:hypothetical protein